MSNPLYICECGKRTLQDDLKQEVTLVQSAGAEGELVQYLCQCDEILYEEVV